VRTHAHSAPLCARVPVCRLLPNVLRTLVVPEAAKQHGLMARKVTIVGLALLLSDLPAIRDQQSAVAYVRPCPYSYTHVRTSTESRTYIVLCVYACGGAMACLPGQGPV
jgi:hypothetical protein